MNLSMTIRFGNGILFFVAILLNVAIADIFIDDGSSGMETRTVGDVTVDITGVYSNNYIRFPEKIEVSYNGKLNGEDVKITYYIYGRIKKVMKEGRNTTLVCFRSDRGLSRVDFIGDPNKSDLKVGGAIIKQSNEEIVAKFNKVIFSDEGVLSGWLVADSNSLPPSKFDGIKKQFVEVSALIIPSCSASTQTVANQPAKTTNITSQLGDGPVTFFAIGKDLKLTLDVNPDWMQRKQQKNNDLGKK